MCPLLIRLGLTFLAILTGTAGLFLITFRTQLVNQDIYKQGLDESGMYELVTSQLERRLIPDRDNEETQGAFVFLDPILANLDIESLVKQTVDRNIDNAFAWLKDERSDLSVYFPKQELLASYNRDDVVANVMDEFDRRIAELPECTPDQVEIIRSEQHENFQLPSCRPPDPAMVAVLKEELHTTVDQTLGSENLIQTALNEAGLGGIGQETPLATLLENNPDSEDILAQLETAKNYLTAAQAAGWVLLGITLILALVVVVTGQISLKRMISVPAGIFLIAGLLLAVIGLIALQLPDSALNLLPLPDDGGQEILAFREPLENIIRFIIPKLFELTLYTGVALFTVSLLFRIAALLIKAPPREAKTETAAPAPAAA